MLIVSISFRIKVYFVGTRGKIKEKVKGMMMGTGRGENRSICIF